MTLEELMALPELDAEGFDTIEIDAAALRENRSLGYELVICSECTSQRYVGQRLAKDSHTVRVGCQKCMKETSHVVISSPVNDQWKSLAIPVLRKSPVMYHADNDPLWAEDLEGNFWRVGWYAGVRYRQRIPRPLFACV